MCSVEHFSELGSRPGLQCGLAFVLIVLECIMLWPNHLLLASHHTARWVCEGLMFHRKQNSSSVTDCIRTTVNDGVVTYISKQKIKSWNRCVGRKSSLQKIHLTMWAQQTQRFHAAWKKRPQLSGKAKHAQMNKDTPEETRLTTCCESQEQRMTSNYTIDLDCFLVGMGRVTCLSLAAGLSGGAGSLLGWGRGQRPLRLFLLLLLPLPLWHRDWSKQANRRARVKTFAHILAV